MGTLRTSEDGTSAAGEGRKAEDVDDDRHVDEGAKIIISSGPTAATQATPAPATPRRSAAISAPALPEKRGGAGLVILVYLLAAAALGYAIYERYLM